ncbi:MAG: methyltransferase domain-containing protein [Methanobacteriota archaeon]|nr:MAG: methyltransferase domain-containing protein [Euryarchaeota archaeon]
MIFLDPLSLQTIQSTQIYPQELEISLNVGKEVHQILLESPEQFRFNEYVFPLPPESADERTIWIWREDHWEKWQYFDETSGKFYKMVFVASSRPPTIEISGIKMHVTEDGDPLKDTHQKIRTLGRVMGWILDTCCGLGYTAIYLARLPRIEKVITIEKDHTMLQLCRENPWSQELFSNSRIELLEGDTSELIKNFRDAQFGGILHDPPRYALAPELYEVDFYRQCYRVLKRKGHFYHYTGNPQKGRKRGLPERTIGRLKEAGFTIVRPAYQGVFARKD